jgi:hypothetical protein
MRVPRRFWGLTRSRLASLGVRLRCNCLGGRWSAAEMQRHRSAPPQRSPEHQLKRQLLHEPLARVRHCLRGMRSVCISLHLG